MLVKALEYLISNKLLCEQVYFAQYGNIVSIDEWIYQSITLKKTPISIFQHIDDLYENCKYNIFNTTEKLLQEIRDAPFVCKYILLWSLKKKIDLQNYERIWNGDMKDLCLNFQTNILTYWFEIKERRKSIESIYPYLDFDRKYKLDIKCFTYTIETSRRIDIEKIFSQKYPFMSSCGERAIICNVMILNDRRKLKQSYRPGIWLNDSFKSDFLFIEFCLYKDPNNKIRAIFDKNGYIHYKCKIGQEIFMKLICEFLNFDIRKEIKNNYVVSGEFKIKKKWKRHLFADLITNHIYLSKIISVYEKRKPLHRRKYLNVLLLNLLFTIRESNEENIVVVRTCKAKSSSDTEFMFLIIQLCFDIYDEKYEYLNSLYTEIESLFPIDPQDITISKPDYRIERLRKINPALFTYNYTREGMLPTFVPEDKISYYRDRGYTIIKYPKEDTPLSFNYMIEKDGYFVGLKRNRLSNKNKYPLIVTGYKTNHLNRPRSITYNYYNSDISHVPQKRDRKKFKIVYEEEELAFPKYLEEFLEYKRIRRASHSSFLKLISFIFKYDYSLLILKLKENKSQLNLCKQDLPNESYLEIMKIIDQDRYTDKLYRLIEEIFDCNIIILSYNSSISRIFDIPTTRFPYIWNIQKEKTLILIKTYKLIYSEEIFIFDFVKYKDNFLFDSSDALCSKLIHDKKKITDRGIDAIPESISQYLDDYGRCVQTYDEINDKWVICRSQPLNLPLKKRNLSKIESHIRKINDIKRTNNLLYLKWNSSNRYFYYFPNKISFLKWKSSIESN